MAELDGNPAMDGRTSQRSLLLVAPIRAGNDVLSSLETLLAAIETPQDLAFDPVIPFKRLTGVHFARILIRVQVRGAAGKGRSLDRERSPIPAKLLFATDFDGTVKDHLLELVAVASEGLDRLFDHCEGWPGLSGRDRSSRYVALADFVGRHCVEANTFYSGTVNRSVGQIRREAELRDAIDAYLDAQAGTPGFPKDALGIRERLGTWIFSDPSFDWVHTRPGPFPSAPLPASAVDRPLRSVILLLGAVAAIAVAALTIFIPIRWAVGIVAATVVLLAAILYGAWRYLSYLAAHDDVIISPDDPHLARFEDRIVQNQLSAFNYVKQPRWFRLGVLRVVLALINVVARYQSTQGTLSGIPSIHFARWVVVDEGRRLLFFSNFDGSWQSYLGDFVDKASEGLTAIWSNTVGFPRTVGLIEGGAADEQGFKAFARGSQVVTHVWYSAYPTLTVSNINDNTRLRLGLYTEMDEKAAQAWLRMAVPRDRLKVEHRKQTERPAVDLEDVQGLVARSYRDLREAVYLPITFDPEYPNDARAWLKGLIDDVTPASCSSEEVAKRGKALNVAFTHRGLAILARPKAKLAGFSREFIEGMAESDHRQRLLGDTAEAAPAHWRWGRTGQPGDSRHAVSLRRRREAAQGTAGA